MRWTGLLVGERAIGENSIIDFLLDGIVEVTLLIIIPTHLVYYFTVHPVYTGPFDFQMSYKALSKWKFTGRCFSFDEVFWGEGDGKGGGGERRKDGQIQSATLDITTTRVNNDLNLHMVALTLFYA